MSLIAGSYEKFVWGFRFKTLNCTPGTSSLTQLFSYPSHLSPIRAVAVGGPIAASSAADDTIKIYDMTSCTEIATLTSRRSSTTALSFFMSSALSFPLNLLSASEDGIVSIFDAGPFVLLKTIRAHKRAVNDLAVHPSGKLALSVGRDSCLAMLNMARGRRSFYCRLDKEATIVKFDLEGGKFFMVAGEKVTIHQSEDARIVFELESQKRVLCAATGSSGLVVTGGEDRNITGWDTNSGKVAYCIEGAHSARVKGIVVLTQNSCRDADVDPYLMSSASSDGVIRVWDVRTVMKESKPLCETETKSRLICLAGTPYKFFKSQQVGDGVPKDVSDASADMKSP